MHDLRRILPWVLAAVAGAALAAWAFPRAYPFFPRDWTVTPGEAEVVALERLRELAEEGDWPDDPYVVTDPLHGEGFVERRLLLAGLETPLDELRKSELASRVLLFRVTVYPAAASPGEWTYRAEITPAGEIAALRHRVDPEVELETIDPGAAIEAADAFLERQGVGTGPGGGARPDRGGPGAGGRRASPRRLAPAAGHRRRALARPLAGRRGHGGRHRPLPVPALRRGAPGVDAPVHGAPGGGAGRPVPGLRPPHRPPRLLHRGGGPGRPGPGLHPEPVARDPGLAGPGGGGGAGGPLGAPVGERPGVRLPLGRRAAPRAPDRRARAPAGGARDRPAHPELDPARRELLFASAGHLYPYVVGADGRVRELASTAYPLGVRPVLEIRATRERLEPGDTLVPLSDGVVEACPEGSAELYGFVRLEESLRRHAGKSVDQARDGILADVARFTGPAPREDDQTLLVLRVP